MNWIRSYLRKNNIAIKSSGVCILLLLGLFSVGYVMVKEDAMEKRMKGVKDGTYRNNDPDVVIIKNFIKVFLHEPGHYSLMTEDGGRVVMHDLGKGDVALYRDVSAGNSNWAVYTKGGSRRGEIHIHSPADISCAGWKADKRSGTTIEVD